MTLDASRCFVVRNGVPVGLRLAPPMLEGNDPFSDGRRYHVSDERLRFSAGLSESSACDLRIDTMPHTEFLIVWRGEVTIQAADNTVLKLLPGDCAIIPAGSRLRWVQADIVIRSFVIFPDAADGAEREVIKINPVMELERCAAPVAEVLLTAPPVAHNRREFVARSGQIRIGVWECTPYARRDVTPTFCELMYLTSGEVTLAELNGVEWKVGPGEAILVPAGATNRWISEQSVRKVFCIVS
ncbi:DUF861 domain-containing protein [Microvirga aerilata]|uniref:DUF861 domain-containing protein n=1 Tax=Microvirga aerilata TaxID=670292 RepID=A0A936ZFU2_9HYPH|nr:cupin domain-containing protein [Microvirga aerilata]MBL0406174.1 DUF861 domain-containing protein [Microvirga aerilata]